ncbi:centrosomal protein of 63 kDa isoform X3 [Tachyglossus aculeatus]|uniref:centrosomal protein of 63 kDa isoform X3 n=1 Tax=Tachyglossus aculeatus TaxID=9261 RepID=UPI0018F39DED|nr:centrosomal protein of 63 kDa isoform X3 [Tachyglossus aculeatus]
MEALLEGMQRRGQGGGFLTSCEAELQELMKQIDIMVAHKRSEWEGQTQALETCLQHREQELESLRVQLDQKRKEVGMLHEQIEDLNKVKQDRTKEYEQELKKLQEELARLKRNYEKLQKKQMRKSREGTRNPREDCAEMERLTGKLEVLQEEKMELKATLQSQEDFINESRIQQEQLQNELTRVTETLHHKELISLESESATCKELSQELIEKHEELKLMEGYHNQCKAEMRKMKEQMLQSEQTYSCALEGMKMEVTQLTRELHQRDMAIERAERKEGEHRVVLAQLETLRQENHHLSEALERLESGVFRAPNFPPTDVRGGSLRTSGTTPRDCLEGSGGTGARPEEGASQTCRRERRDRPVDPIPSGGGRLRNAESRLTRRSHEYKETTKKPQATDCDKIIQLYQGEIEAVESRSSSVGIEPGPRAVIGPSPQLSSSSSTVSLSSDFLLGTESLPTAPDDNQADFSDNGSEESGSNQQGEFLSLCPLPTSPIDSIATRFLEEEEWRSHQILERLNAHIEELKRESERTVKQYSQPR